MILPDGHANAVGKEETGLVVGEGVLGVHLGEQVGFVGTRSSSSAHLVLGILTHHTGGALERVVGQHRGGCPHVRVPVGRICRIVLLVLLGEVGHRKTVDVDSWAR